MKIELTTLGELSCACDGADTELPAKKRRFALLAFLALERSVPRTKVITLFYPEIDERQAGRRLNQSIYAIRQDLGNCIESRGGELRAREFLISDAYKFGNLAEKGEFERAFDLYRRPFLDGFYLNGAIEWDRWVERRRAVLARMYVQAARMLTTKLLDQGDFAVAAEYASRWIELDNDNEEAHRIFMTALLRAGRGFDALRHYKAWERTQLEESGDSPSPQMCTFVETLRSVIAAAGMTEIELEKPERERVVAIAPPQPADPPRPHMAGPASNGSAGMDRFKLALRRYFTRRIAAL